MIRKDLSAKDLNDTNIDLIFLLYWGVLVFWQNINPGSTGSTADTLIKTCLILFLVGYYLLHTHTFRTSSLALSFLFAAAMVISFLSESAVELRNILTYFFPVAFAFLSCCTGGRFQINLAKLLRFMWGIVAMVLYMALYAVVATPDKFLRALTASSAYGNELTSFFISNHEYGLYLMAGITACILLMELVPKRTGGRTAFLLGCIAFFAINLVLTYSRTSMLATALIVVIYMLLNRKSKMAKLFFIVLLLLAIVVATVPELREYFLKIVLKDNNLAGRDDLAALAMETFEKASLRGKLFGQGATEMASFFKEETDHASVHNAYLQILLYFGMIPLFTMIVFLIWQVIADFKMIKKNRTLAVLFIGLLFACVSTMFTNTAILFSSPVDSFFLTVFTVLIPQYVRNAVMTNSFGFKG